MKKIIIILAALAGFVLAGCGPGTVQSPPEKSPSEQQPKAGTGKKRGGPMETNAY